MQEIPSDFMNYMAGVVRVLAHPHRLRIIELIDLRGPMVVHELTQALDLPQASVSGHLGKMRTAGLIRSDRKGKEVQYCIANRYSLTLLNCIRERSGIAKGLIPEFKSKGLRS